MEDDFRKKIQHKLASFEKKSKEWEWSDLIRWLNGLKSVMVKTSFALLDEHIITISKRLSQCLSPSLPHGLHSTTLDLYDILLKKSNPKHIFILSSGLFQHFQYCAPQNKFQFLQIITENFLNKQELMLLTSGLVACLISGAGDKQETLNKIIEMLESMQNQEVLHFSIWNYVLKSKKFKNIGLMYMQKRTNLSICEDLIVNSLLESLEDSSVISKRLALDLIKKCYQLNNDNQTVVVLMKGVLKLIKGKDHSLIRRLWEWAFPEEINASQILIVKKVMKHATALIFEENHYKILEKNLDDPNEIKLNSLKIVEEIIDSEGIGENFVKDIAIPLLIHAIRDNLLVIEGPSSGKFKALLENYWVLFWESIIEYVELSLLNNEIECLEILQFSIKNLKASEELNTKLLMLLAPVLHKFSNFSEFVEVIKEIVEKLAKVPRIKLRHTRKKIMSIIKQNQESLLLSYTFLISKFSQSQESIFEIIAYLKVSAGKNLALSLKAVLAFPECSLTEDDFQALWRKVPSQNVDILEILSKSFQMMPNEWTVGLTTLLLSLSRDVHIRSFITFWEYSNKFHSQQLLSMSRSGEIIFIMIDHLNDTNPTVRHAAKEWLNLAIKSIMCVVDPILCILLHINTARKLDENNDLTYISDFDTDRVRDVFQKVSLLLIIDNTIVNSLYTSETSLFIKEYVEYHSLFSSNYLELFIEVSLHYIKTKSKFQPTEISKIHSSASEVLRLLSGKSPSSYIPKLLTNVGEIIYKMFGTKLESTLLAVLHELFQHQLYFGYPSRTADVLVLGLRNSDYYLRDQWSKAITLALPSILESFHDESIYNYIKILVLNYCDMISQNKDNSLVTGLYALIHSILRYCTQYKNLKSKAFKNIIFNDLEKLLLIAINFNNSDEIIYCLAEIGEIFPNEMICGLLDIWQKHINASSLQTYQKIIGKLGMPSETMLNSILIALDLKKYNEIIVANLLYNIIEKMYHSMNTEEIWAKILSALKMLDNGKWDEVLAWHIKIVHLLLSLAVPDGKSLKDLQKIIENIVTKCIQGMIKWQAIRCCEFSGNAGSTVLDIVIGSLIYSHSMFRIVWKSSQSKMIKLITELAKNLLENIRLIEKSGENVTKLLSTLLISFPLIFDGIKNSLIYTIKNHIFEILEKFPESIEYWYDIINTIPKHSVLQILDVYDIVFWKSNEYKFEMLSKSLAIISLILLSSEKDAYLSSLSFISKRVDEVLAFSSIPEKLFSLILILLRVLSARISDFEEIWQKLWPELFTGMFKYLNRKSLPISFHIIKFIDMMIVSYPRFSEAIWMFLYDVPEILLLPGNTYGEFRPAVNDYLKGFNVLPSRNTNGEEFTEKIVRNVLMNDKHAENQEDLEKYVKILIQYTLLYSTERLEINWESVEQSLRNEIVNIRGLIN